MNDAQLRQIVHQIRSGWAINGTAHNTDELEELAMAAIQAHYQPIVAAAEVRGRVDELEKLPTLSEGNDELQDYAMERYVALTAQQNTEEVG